MDPWYREPAGRFEELVIESPALADNPLGDPHRRPLWVYLPPGYDRSSAAYPSVYVLQGFGSQVDMWRNRKTFRRTFPELVDGLFAEGAVPPAIVVFVDAWTSLGGSQFLDSPAVGRYATYLCDEVVDFIDSRFRTLADAAHRGVMGHSSGGYGALVSGLRRPDRFRGLASHAGDALFEVAYLPMFRAAARALRDHYEGSYQAFWDDFRSRLAWLKPSDGDLVDAWAYAACYSADPDGSVRLPFDTDTAALVPEIWSRWLEHDPVRMVAGCADGARAQRAIWIDAGRRDEFFLDLAAEALRRELGAVGVGGDVLRFELFEGRHGGVEYRYPLSLRYLVERLSP